VVADHQLFYQYQKKGETQTQKSIISDWVIVTSNNDF
jgi:hypothetical protein